MPSNVMYTTIYVTDQDDALAFYTEGLGLEKRVDYPAPDGRFLTVGTPGSPVEIILWRGEPAAPRWADGGGPGTVPGPVILESEDLRSEFQVLRDRGVTFEEPEPVDYPFGVRVTAFDPDGNRISLRQRRRPQRAEG